MNNFFVGFGIRILCQQKVNLLAQSYIKSQESFIKLLRWIMMAIRQMCVCMSVCVSRRSLDIVDKQVVTHLGSNYTKFSYEFLVCSPKVCYSKI